MYEGQGKNPEDKMNTSQPDYLALATEVQKNGSNLQDWERSFINLVVETQLNIFSPVQKDLILRLHKEKI